MTMSSEVQRATGARTRRSVGRRTLGFRPNVPGALALVVIVAFWQLAVEVGWLTYQFLPAPSTIGRAMSDMTSSGELSDAMGHTVSAALAGWGIASVAGVAVGLAMGLSRPVWRYGMSTVEILRSVPAISLVPVAILVFGFSLRMEVAIITYVCWWPVLVATVTGVGQVTVRHRDVARQLQLGRLAHLQKITLPAAMGDIIVAMRLALSLALALAVVSEMIGNPHGVGYQMVLAQQSIRPDRMLAYIVVIGILGILFNAVFVGATRWLFPGLVRAQGDEA